MKLSFNLPANKNTIIVGCGRFGSYLANSLSANGALVTIIDKHKEAFRALSNDFSGFTIEGDAAEIENLELARIREVVMFIAASPRDNLNLFVSRVARALFSVSEVIARIDDPELEPLCRGLGIRPFCPTTVAVERFLGQLQEERK